MITVSDLTLQYMVSPCSAMWIFSSPRGTAMASSAQRRGQVHLPEDPLRRAGAHQGVRSPILPKTRMSVLKQNQNAYDAYNVMDTVIMGQPAPL